MREKNRKKMNVPKMQNGKNNDSYEDRENFQIFNFQFSNLVHRMKIENLKVSPKHENDKNENDENSKKIAKNMNIQIMKNDQHKKHKT